MKLIATLALLTLALWLAWVMALTAPPQPGVYVLVVATEAI